MGIIQTQSRPVRRPLFTAGGGGSGASIVGGVLTVNGSFGTVASAPPTFWETFESYANGTAGNLVTGSTAWSSDKPLVSTARSHSGSKSIGAKLPFISVSGQPGGTFAEEFYQWGLTPPSNTRKFYYSGWYYLDQTVVATHNNFGNPFSSIHQDIRVYKFFRAGAGTPYDGHFQFADTANMDQSLVVGGHDVGMISQADVNNTAFPNNNPGGGVGGAIGGQWVFYEVICDAGTPGNADATWQYYLNGSLLWNLGPFNMLNVSSTQNFDWIFFFNGADYYFDTEYITYLDEAYCDCKTKKRVIITDNAVYSSSTKFAQQLSPTATWSDPQIVTPFFQSNLTSASTGYVHIWLDDGSKYGTVNTVTVP